MMRKKIEKDKWFLHKLYERIILFKEPDISNKHIKLFFEYSLRETGYGELKYPKMLYSFFKNLIGYIGKVESRYTGQDIHQNQLFNILAKTKRGYLYFTKKFYELESVNSKLFFFEQLFNIYYDKYTFDKLKGKKVIKWKRVFVSHKKKLRRIMEEVYTLTLWAIVTIIDPKKKYEYKLYEGILKFLIDFFKQNEEIIIKYKVSFQDSNDGLFARILRLFGNGRLKEFYLKNMGNVDYYTISIYS